MKNTVIHGDCLIEMQRIADKSVDLTVTSPPYDNLRTYNGSLEWSFEIFQGIAKELYRVTKDGGVVVWVVADATINGSETGTSFKQALYFKEIGFDLYDTMIWQKPSPQAPTEGRYYNVFEYMFVFSKNKPKTLNLITDRANVSAGNISNVEVRSNKEQRKFTGAKRITKEFSRRFNVWTLNRGCSETTHPAVFPLQLATDHIISWSNEGDTVLDPFGGSGTTAIACMNTNRNYILIEKEQKYIEIIKDRIENHRNLFSKGA